MKNSLSSEIINKLSPLAKYAISTSISIVTDSDKIDIFDQRAKGIYNSPYIMEKINIYPPKNATFSDILRDYFKFKFVYEDKMNTFEYGKDIIDLINHESNTNTKDYIIKNIIKTEEINSSNFYINKIKFDGNNGTIVYTVDGIRAEITNSEIYEMFNKSSWYDISLNCQGLSADKIEESKENDDTYKALKRKYYQDKKNEKTGEIINRTNITITIPRDTLERNLENLENVEERINAFRYLVVGKDDFKNTTDNNTLAYRFKLKDDNAIHIGWISELVGKDSEHLVNSSLSALLWQLNQFIFVNMRNTYSLEILKKEKILDNILTQYKNKAEEKEKRKYESTILEEYIEYTKGFIDFVLDRCYNSEKGFIDFLTPEFLKECRDEYATKYITKINSSDEPIGTDDNKINLF